MFNLSYPPHVYSTNNEGSHANSKILRDDIYRAGLNVLNAKEFNITLFSVTIKIFHLVLLKGDCLPMEKFIMAVVNFQEFMMTEKVLSLLNESKLKFISGCFFFSFYLQIWNWFGHQFNNSWPYFIQGFSLLFFQVSFLVGYICVFNIHW